VPRFAAPRFVAPRWRRAAVAGCTVLAFAATGLPALAGHTHAPAGAATSRSSHPGTVSQTGRHLVDPDQLDPPRYSLKDAIVQHVQVPSRDGLTKLWVDLIRPRTATGVRVPTIMDVSPYFNTLGRGWRNECKTAYSSVPWGDVSPPCSPAVAFPEWYDEYYVPRGYAVALVDLRGTRNSSGCEEYGSRNEVYDAVDSVDWVAGQSWSNGKVGLTGGSYDGTLAVGAAVEQPISGRHKNAVAAVIPIRAIDRWYDYSFANGVPFQGQATTPYGFTAEYQSLDFANSNGGDPLFAPNTAVRRGCVATDVATVDAGYAPTYTDANSSFWAPRDFVKDARGTKSAFFLIHGLFDTNVKTDDVGQLWQALPAGLPKKLWLIDGDHVDPATPTIAAAIGDKHVLPHPFADDYVRATHRWWLQFLKGVPAGALDTPTVEVQRADGHFDAYRRWPAAGTDAVLSFTPTGQLLPTTPTSGSVTWSDGASAAPAQQVFVTPTFSRDTRISGQVAFDLRISATGPDTTIGVRIDDLPPGAGPAAKVTDNVYDEFVTGALTVTYGWLRAWYRSTVHERGRSTPASGSPLVPAQSTAMSFPSLYVDFVVKAGHRLRFTFADAALDSIPASTGGTVSLMTGAGLSRVKLPVAPL
jgi:X-Pro dipeptidyl-peptidase